MNSDHRGIIDQSNKNSSALHLPGESQINSINLQSQMNSVNFQQTSISHYPYPPQQIPMPLFISFPMSLTMPMLPFSYNQPQFPGYGNTFHPRPMQPSSREPNRWRTGHAERSFVHLVCRIWNILPLDDAAFSSWNSFSTSLNSVNWSSVKYVKEYVGKYFCFFSV